MNKVILMSIRPEWLVKILNGEKTIEIRKSMPKCELPIDVYLYCTKGKSLLRLPICNKEWCIDVPFGWVVDKKSNFNGKVVAKFTLNKCYELEFEGEDWNTYYCKNTIISGAELERKSCLTQCDMEEYARDKNIYAWHIDNLVVFDEPKDLWDFHTRHDMLFLGRAMARKVFQFESVYKAPQSWQYAYKENEEFRKGIIVK